LLQEIPILLSSTSTASDSFKARIEVADIIALIALYVKYKKQSMGNGSPKMFRLHPAPCLFAVSQHLG
jgi:hypothetical protein